MSRYTIDDADWDNVPGPYRVLTARCGVARKAHLCDDHGGFIAPGERYNMVAALNDGRFGVTRHCLATRGPDGVPLRACIDPPPIEYPDPEPPADPLVCPHGIHPGDCNACDVASDFAHDAAREARCFR